MEREERNLRVCFVLLASIIWSWRSSLLSKESKWGGKFSCAPMVFSQCADLILSGELTDTRYCAAIIQLCFTFVRKKKIFFFFRS